MASLPSFRSILKTDVPNSPNWVQSLLYPINNFFQSVYTALNGGLTLGTNIASQINKVSFTTASTGALSSPITFTNNLSTTGQALFIGQFSRQSGTTTESISLPIWTDQNGTITITSIPGLSGNITYNFTFVLF